MDEHERGIDATEQEISLVDILALFIRYRRLLALLVGLAAVLALGAVLLLPGIMANRLAAGQNAEAHAVLSPSQAVGSLLDAVVLDEYAVRVFNDPALILAALRSAGIPAVDGLDISEKAGDAALATVRRRLVNNQDRAGRKLQEASRLYEVRLSSGNLDVRVLHSDEQKALAALHEMIVLANARLRGFVGGMAAEEIRTYEHLLSIENPGQGIIEALSIAYLRYNAAKLVTSGAEPVFVNVYGPYAMRPLVVLEVLRSSVAQKAILAFLGAVFLSVLLVFLLNGVDSIRHDKDAMAKISAALAKK